REASPAGPAACQAINCRTAPHAISPSLTSAPADRRKRSDPGWATIVDYLGPPGEDHQPGGAKSGRKPRQPGASSGDHTHYRSRYRHGSIRPVHGNKDAHEHPAVTLRERCSYIASALPGEGES